MSYTGKKYFKRFKDYTREKVVNVVHLQTKHFCRLMERDSFSVKRVI